MVGRDGRTYGLGYKAHIAEGVYSDLPLAFIAASANENEKRHAPGLLDKTVEAAGGARAPWRFITKSSIVVLLIGAHQG